MLTLSMVELLSRTRALSGREQRREPTPVALARFLLKFFHKTNTGT